MLSSAAICRQTMAILILAMLPFAADGQSRSSPAPPIPGSGSRIPNIGDDFEEPDWSFHLKLPKSSRNIDDQEHGPLAVSKNNRLMEGPHRGTPDIVQRVPTPPFGLPGSDGSLLIQTLRPGIPGRITGKSQQDDLMVKARQILGHTIPVTWNPSAVVRVYIPEFSEFEDRSGTHFGFRTDMYGKRPGEFEETQYWPGIFVNFRSETDRGVDRDSAFLTVRADYRGRDIKGPEVTQSGWWTMGMSISADGKCHFFAKPGVEDLTREDWLGSHFCYNYRCEHLDLAFFNVVTTDDGRSLSTKWIVDDPMFYCIYDLAHRPTNSDYRTRR